MTGFADVPFSQIKGNATSNQSLVDNFAKLESTTQTVEAAAFSIYDSLNAQHYDLTSSGNTLYYSGNLVLDNTTGALIDEQSQVIGMAQLNLFDVTADAYAGLTVDNGELLLAGNPVGGDPITTGSTDNAILRADGTGGATLQNSAIVIDDEIVPFACTGVASTDVVTAVGHNFTANQGVRFPTLTGGGNLNTTTIYFVRDISGNTFKVSTTAGGSARDITTDMTAGTVVAVQENVTIRNNSTTTNSPIVLTPKGNGGFVLGPKPDGTSTGGNARGIYAVDLSPPGSGVASRVASGAYSFRGPYGESATGDYSVSFAGGRAEAIYGFAAGAQAIVSLNYSTSLNGGNCSAYGAFSVGERAISDRIGMFSYQGGKGPNWSDGVHQWSLTNMYAVTTNAVATEMLCGAEPGGGTARFTLRTGTVFAFTVHVVGVKSDGSAIAEYQRRVKIKNVGGTTSLVGTVDTIGTDYEDNAAADVAITADDTNDALKIQVTGIASETWRWIAVVYGNEQGYGT
jgi:hypothetical protein